ncbi:uncharacterized protein HMPREF1541_06059 [Cyphellophora europaea CBS 101466]|uniref:HIT-type domain-containing protein n=1 Tax=Cyphellophora europaea (strain CBS 101466) TaxID=1220924 RepID=W2RVN9_CYPE1|nr:uncharacterized protein HMPREF1541_06059 [Cyphellophora europaea CBS 101466]ETN39833.1 hypothetical protein HMPREF1541_06059 [Cyphellophora europaea CBS 101466]
MPLIEVLPLHHPTRSQPGWAYILDTATSSTAHQQPSGNRKRARIDAASSAAHISAKQQKAIEQRLKDLDKENWKDAVVPVPKRERGGDGAGAGATTKKMTSNVRRILGYNRAFAHYLADEEAALAAGGGGFQGTWGSGLSTSANAGGGAAGSGSGAAVGGGRRGDDKRKSTGAAAAAAGKTSAAAAAATGTKGRGRAKVEPKAEVKTEQQEQQQDDGDAEMKDAQGAPEHDASADSTSAASVANEAQPQPPIKPRYSPALDADPLLKTVNLPAKPSARVMAALLAEPPLSYAAARATPLDPDRQTPRRHFCVVCGYWGKVRCKKCGERTCGLLECWKGHEEGGCAAGY